MRVEDTQLQPFNLLDEPWIPCIDAQGQSVELSGRQAILDGANYRDLGGELATVRFAISRILMSIVYRVLDDAFADDPDVADVEFWQGLWNEGGFPEEWFEEYFEEFRDRFNLNDPVAPFMQVPDLRTAKDEWKAVPLLVADVDVDRPLFTMRSELDSLSLAEAARWLVHANAYDFSGIKSGAVGDERVKGGRGYPLGVGWCGWMGGILLTGDNLFQTLLLNYIPGASLSRDTEEEDVPIWERPVLTSRPRNTTEIGHVGPIALMTWPQRRFRLRFDGDRVDGVLVTNGDALDYTIQHDTEIMSGWRFSEPQTRKAKQARYMPQAWQADRALWRGLATLMAQGERAVLKPTLAKRWNVTEAIRPAKSVEWLRRLVEHEVLPKSDLVEVTTASMEYGPQMSSYGEVVSDRLTFAAALADLAHHPELLRLAQAAAADAEGVARAIGGLASDLDVAVGGDGEGAWAEVQAQFYSALDQEYRQWLVHVRPGCDVLDLQSSWRDTLRSQARRSAELQTQGISPSAWQGRVNSVTERVVSLPTALARFDRALSSVLGARPAKDKPVLETSQNKENNSE